MPHEIPWEQWPEELAQLLVATESIDYSAALTACRPILLQSFRDNFNSSASAENVDWPPRKIVGDGHPLLMDTGALMQAATGGGPGHISRIGTDVLELGVDSSVQQGGIPGASSHQFGYPPRNIPARPYLGLREKQAGQIEEVIANHVESQLEKR